MNTLWNKIDKGLVLIYIAISFLAGVIGFMFIDMIITIPKNRNEDYEFYMEVDLYAKDHTTLLYYEDGSLVELEVEWDEIYYSPTVENVTLYRKKVHVLFEGYGYIYRVIIPIGWGDENEA